MAHLSSIGAAIFTDLAVAYAANTGGVATATAYPTDSTGLQALFVTATSNNKYFRLNNVREFPPIGAQPNIVNVPVFGQKQSQTVGAQSDAPTLEVTINYVAADWVKGAVASTWTTGDPAIKGSELANMVGDGVKRVWRLALLNAAPTAVSTASLNAYDSVAAGLGTVPNTQFFWHGKLESMLITPSLSDATTATLSFSIQSDFYGAFTS